MLEFRKTTTNVTGEEFVTIFSSHFDVPIVAQSSHANYDRIIEELDNANNWEDNKETAERIQGLADMTIQVEREFTKLTDRISVANGIITFDGDEIHNALTEQITKFIREGKDFGPLLNFMENVYQNPSEGSRVQSYEWLEKHDLTITSDGLVVAYKGVRTNGTGKYLSINSGPAIIDGVEHKSGQVPNQPGSVIEIPRSQVDDDVETPCSRGLHVGSYDYANGFGSVCLEVHVNPRDIVSVPRDHNHAKVRVCRYKVIDVVEEKYNDAVISYERTEGESPWWIIND